MASTLLVRAGAAPAVFVDRERYRFGAATDKARPIT
jgi:hypothetical protein